MKAKAQEGTGARGAQQHLIRGDAAVERGGDDGQGWWTWTWRKEG